MILINEHYLKLKSSYLFADIARRVTSFQEKHPDMEIIKLGIGDVTLPLPKACLEAMHKAVDEMGKSETFRGYGPEQGYAFLREKIAEFDFQARGAQIEPDEIFISDGAKCDTGNFQELFAQNITIAVPDPVYPVYVDTNVMAGRTGSFTNGRYEGLVYLESTKENNFIPELPKTPVDLIYLCFPNNPTGATITKEELKKWVDYAHEHKALILFDAAYEAFIRDEDLPHSIYEIDGAKEVAIEFRSYSKTAGFTGTRCAYTVVPKACMAYDQSGKKHPVHELWNRRHTTKFNGVSYPVQKAAEAVYSPEGQEQVKTNIDYYLENARKIRTQMQKLGFTCVGGENSPYVWIDGQMDSWEFFDLLLNKAGVVCTPGAGFGKCGQGFIRISAFNSHENVEEAMRRIEKALG
ncbi:LL-diaminopimelate aminotransferase [Desulfohalobiaceae bacterium Ax17]|jgi:LL-diaminopimelate aminotransferase|uniref:LL-diaminopimelate aminotransferase n=1 Tax=Desulfovulcanus ferrireducens TaxID=2831190 RepID=UPI00207BC551|nr:LL-diaminopimelate aminotransferase [Desulfovulcanus ferrireducens]MBT8763838.1 LL-diaminopimelate aminotransferase [Desulfovulcanus ferrireducens]